MSELAPGTIFEGRYRIERLRSDGRGFVARALAGGTVVELIEVPAGNLRALAPAMKFTHRRLVAIRETTTRTDGTTWLVVEHARGSALDQVLKGGKLPAEVAVMIGIDLSDALVGLHQRGGVHGLIRPASIIVDPDDFSSAVLGFAAPTAGPNPFRLAESAEGGPTPEGDVWALAGVVHCMLLGESPPVYGYPSRELVPHAEMPPDLVDFLAACLAQEPDARVTAAHTMRDLLACSRANSLRPGAMSGQPPPPEVLRPGPLPTVQELPPPGLLAPPVAPLMGSRVQHISIPKPQVAKAGGRGWLLVVVVVAALALVGLLALFVL